MNGYGRADFAGVSVALSRDGTTLVFGAPEDYALMTYGDYIDYPGAGYVEVHRFDPGSEERWSIAGSRLEGNTNFEVFGRSVAVNGDGSRIAIGKPSDAYLAPSSVSVYEWDAGQADWAQVGHSLPHPHNSSLLCGKSVAMSDDGSTLAIGCFKEQSDLGLVRVYAWDAVGDAWTRLGGDLDVEHDGHMVALSSDGWVVAIGAPLSDTPTPNSGSVRVYAWNDALGEWAQRGNSMEHDVEDAEFGTSVALSADGNVLAIGAPGYWADFTKGRVGVFKWEGGAWVAMGDAIVGLIEHAHIGESVALNAHGDVLAVGAHGLYAYHYRERTGHIDVRVHAWDAVAGAWTAVGSGIDGGENGLDNLYSSVALDGDGTRLAVGAWPLKSYASQHNPWEVSKGKVRVYDAVESG